MVNLKIILWKCWSTCSFSSHVKPLFLSSIMSGLSAQVCGDTFWGMRGYYSRPNPFNSIQFSSSGVNGVTVVPFKDLYICVSNTLTGKLDVWPSPKTGCQVQAPYHVLDNTIQIQQWHSLMQFEDVPKLNVSLYCASGSNMLYKREQSLPCVSMKMCSCVSVRFLQHKFEHHSQCVILTAAYIIHTTVNE